VNERLLEWILHRYFGGYDSHQFSGYIGDIDMTKAKYGAFRILQCPDCGHIQRTRTTSKHLDCSVCRGNLRYARSFGLDIRKQGTNTWSSTARDDDWLWIRGGI